MPLLRTIGRAFGTGIKAGRLLVRGSVRSGRWATRRVGDARARGAAHEIGMVRLFDLHALSCAGDTLIAIGLAGTIFFNVPLGEARSKVALYLLVTMVPFALLAPVIGPLLDHFRHGRRYALAVTMLGRAFLAWLISDHLFGLGLYPAAFAVLALSRAYGVARSAAVPRLLPDGIGLSQVGARASVYGTFAGAMVAPIGLAAFWFGPQWPLRVSSIIFLVGMVVALRLPPRADSDPPEEVPRPIRTALRLRRGPDRPLSGRLVIATLVGSATLRCLYGFLLLYFAFAVKGGQLDTTLFGRDVGSQGAVAVIGGALAVGTFLATAVGTKLHIRRPTALQSSGLTITAGVAVLATIFYGLVMVALLALVTAIFSGISKLAVDASIQERVPERLRASAFAHSETVLMLAWVAGGAVGIIPMDGRVGMIVAAAFAVVAAIRAAVVAGRLHGDHLQGRPDATVDDATVDGRDAAAPSGGANPAPPSGGADPVAPSGAGGRETPSGAGGPETPNGAPEPEAAADGSPVPGAVPGAGPPARNRSPNGSGLRTAAPGILPPGDTDSVRNGEGRRWGRWRRRAARAEPDASGAVPPGRRPADRPTATTTENAAPPAPASRDGQSAEAAGAGLAPPGYHIYRPSSAARRDNTGSDADSGQADR
ncbi:putative MFS family arabinose efflux permease [Krasilnikovia cinnamomea]|uniref:Putative MFS family arabinose efflux permease n=1 Tax=Krasilnikovia cinnamomea TaxID=349313 RepID=A0A4Q7ZN39_9ACTN|nr:putative MFS family arabinose efflux permease [Krasilnikovia cinnamomea]